MSSVNDSRYLLDIQKKMEAMLKYQKPEDRNQKLLQYYIDELFTFPCFRTTVVQPPAFGIFVYYIRELYISEPGYPYNVKMRLIGPRGSTIKRMEHFCQCSINVHPVNYDHVIVYIASEDYISVARWKVDLAEKCINDVLRIPANGRDIVYQMQMAELAVRNGTYENRIMHFH
ncbi:KH domain-containing RNA-binding protein qki.S [Trichinella spiralis]|uniref:KH domain-containing RNA-binding protein qki.S n=2 Tax=Trichinella spiralis TaxID=6334 RepID=A0ABR3KAF6_TRISP|nr:female germline-specific tumor suppressor gld-1 [Trichinella spiralis]